METFVYVNCFPVQQKATTTALDRGHLMEEKAGCMSLEVILFYPIFLFHLTFFKLFSDV